jgi:hypothetical protein
MKTRISMIFLLALATLSAQRFDDGTTLPGFVLDAEGCAWHKVRPERAKSHKPEPQACFIADPSTNRGGNALHPKSFPLVEEIAREMVRRDGSTAKWKIEWVDSTGLAGGYQLIVTSERGERSTSCALIAIQRMKKSRAEVVDDLYREHRGIL